MPGVTAVGATNALPLSGDNSSGSLTIEGRPAPTPATRPNADRRSVTPGYHDAMGIRLQGGRLFTAADDERAPLVVIVSRAFADRYWPGENAIGKRVKLARFETEAPWRTVVGIVNDVQHASLAERPRPVVYYPHAQGPDGDMQLVVRAASAPGAIAGGVREAMQRIDADLPVTELKPMTAFLERRARRHGGRVVAPRLVRADGARAGRGGHLRRDGVRGRAAAARVRDPARARRGAARSASGSSAAEPAPDSSPASCSDWPARG